MYSNANKPSIVLANTSVIELYVYSVRAYRHKAACFLDVFCFIWAVRFLLAFCFIRAVWFLRVIWLLRVVCFPRVVWFLGVVCFLMVVWFLKVERFLRVPRIVHARQNHREATPHPRCRCCTKLGRAKVHHHPNNGGCSELDCRDVGCQSSPACFIFMRAKMCNTPTHIMLMRPNELVMCQTYATQHAHMKNESNQFPYK